MPHVTHRLPPAEAARLRQLPTTAPDGMTATTSMPGWRTFSQTRQILRKDFEAAANELMRWRVQTSSGLRVWAEDEPLTTGSVILMRLGLGPFSQKFACRVRYVIDKTDRRGFAYETLPGHPEVGVEEFVLERRVDGVYFTVSACGRPRTRVLRALAPVVELVQDAMTRRYLRALDTKHK